MIWNGHWISRILKMIIKLLTCMKMLLTKMCIRDRIQRAEYRAYPRAIKMFIEGRPKVVGRKVVFENGAK